MTVTLKLIFWCITLLLPTLSLGASNIEQLIFPKGSKESCRQIDRSLRPKLNAIAPGVLKTTNDLIRLVEEKKSGQLAGLFHSRMKISSNQMKLLFKKIGVVYGWPVDVTEHRLWSIHSKKSPKLVACKNDQLAIGPHYGYQIQFGVWLQLLGQRELGRIYASLVEHQPGQWKLGTLHLQQWTHKEVDPYQWVEQALEEKSRGSITQAFIKLDLARKLLNGGGYIYPAFVQDIEKTQSTLIKGGDFYQFFKSKFDVDDVVYAASMFAEDGAGIAIRLLVDQNMKTSELKARCENVVTKIFRQLGPKASMGGVRCGYVVNGESFKVDGHLGSRFISKAKISKLLNGS